MHWNIEISASNLIYRIRKCQHTHTHKSGSRMAAKILSRKVRISNLNGMPGAVVLGCGKKTWGLKSRLGPFGIGNSNCEFKFLLGSAGFICRGVSLLLGPAIPMADAGAASQRFSRGFSLLPKDEAVLVVPGLGY